MAGILGSVYRALDPILPFDRYLDPRFGVLGGGGQPQAPVGGVLGYSAAPTPQAPQMPARRPEIGMGGGFGGEGLAGGPPQRPAGIDPLMGFPAMPQGRAPAVTAEAPRMGGDPAKPWKPSALDTLWGVAAGYSPNQVRRQLTIQHQQDLAAQAGAGRANEERARFLTAIAGLTPAQQAAALADPKAYAEAVFTPRVVGEAAYTLDGYAPAPMSPAQQAAARKPITTEGGAYVPQGYTDAGVPTGYGFQGAPQIVKVEPTENVLEVTPGAGGAPGGASLGERNNNPGNLEDGPFARSQPGYVGTDGRFAQFATPEAGAAAQETLLANAYIGRGQNTIQSIIEGVPGDGGRRVHGYSPRQSDGGDNTDEQVNNYIGYVARRAGVDPTAPIPPDRVSAVAAAMREFETGQRPGAQGGGARVVQQGTAKPGWTTDPTGRFQISPEGKREALPGLTMPPKLQAAEDEDLAAIEAATGVNSLLNNYQAQIENGSMNLGPLENAWAPVARWAGKGSPNDIAVGSFRAGLERMRNESLRLNKGIQTEGDSQRAWNELVTNINDENFVKQRLKEIQAINERAVEIRQAAIALRRQRSGLPPMEGIEAFMTPTEFPQQGGAEIGGSGARQSPTAGAPRTTKPPVQVRSLQEAESLPKGTVFVLNGRRGVVR